MDYKKQYFKTKYEKLKAEEPSNLVSKGVVGLFRLISLLFIAVSVLGIAAGLMQLSKTDGQQALQTDWITILPFVSAVCLFIAAFIIRAFGARITKRNNYIQELDRLASDMLNENVADAEKKAGEENKSI